MSLDFEFTQAITVCSSKGQALQLAYGLKFLSTQAYRLWVEHPLRFKVKSVYQIAAGLGALATWVAAVEVVGLIDLLKGDDYITVFAPNDQAFSKMSRNCVEEMLDDFDKFAANIRYHIAPGRVTSGELGQIDSLRTMLKDDLLIDARRGLQVNNARIVEPDIECRNGVIHIIDSVLTLRKHSKVRAGQFAVEQEYLNLGISS